MVSWSCCFSRVVMLMSCDRSSLSYHRSFFAVSICTCLSFLRAPKIEAPINHFAALTTEDRIKRPGNMK